MLVACSAARAESPAPPAAKPAAPAEAREPTAWELDVYAGYGRLAWPSTDTASEVWSNGGPAFALTVAYRGDHFTHPFLDVSYIPILSSGKYVNIAQPGGPATMYVSNSTYALGFVVGAGWDIDWFRARLGLGLYSQHVTTNVTGTSDSANQIGLGFLAAVSALVWQPDPFALGVEARLVALEFPTNGIYQTMWSVGLTGRWDFAHSK
jgi:hypothetical protein